MRNRSCKVIGGPGSRSAGPGSPDTIREETIMPSPTVDVHVALPAFCDTAGTCGSIGPNAVFLDDLAVQFDAAAGAQVLDDVPVDGRLVRALEEFEPPAERDVDGAVHLLVEVDVPHVPVHAWVAADAQLADAAGAVVGVERLEQKAFLALGGRIDHAAFREAKAN